MGKNQCKQDKPDQSARGEMQLTNYMISSGGRFFSLFVFKCTGIFYKWQICFKINLITNIMVLTLDGNS